MVNEIEDERERQRKKELVDSFQNGEDPQPVRSNLIPITAADCLDYPSVNYILEGLIEAETITLFSGKEKIGKSYVLMDLALHMAAELPWLDIPTMTDEKGGVLWLDFDMSRNTTTRRINQITNGIEESWNIRKPDLFKNFGLIDGQLFRESGYNDSFQFFDESDAVIGLQEYIIANNVKVCFIDNLVEIEGEAQENSSNDIQKVFSGLKKLRDITHCAFIVIHHTTKDGFRGRGSSAIFGETDLNLQLDQCTNPDQLVLNTDGARNSSLQKIGMRKDWIMRCGEDGFPMTDNNGHFIYNFKLSRIDTDGLETEKEEKVTKGRRAATMTGNVTKIVKFFQDNNNTPATKTAIAKELTGGKDDRLKSVQNAYNEGILEVNSVGMYYLKQPKQ